MRTGNVGFYSDLRPTTEGLSALHKGHVEKKKSLMDCTGASKLQVQSSKFKKHNSYKPTQISCQQQLTSQRVFPLIYFKRFIFPLTPSCTAPAAASDGASSPSEARRTAARKDSGGSEMTFSLRDTDTVLLPGRIRCSMHVRIKVLPEDNVMLTTSVMTVERSDADAGREVGSIDGQVEAENQVQYTQNSNLT